VVGKFSSSHLSDGYLGDRADLQTVEEIRTKSGSGGNLTWKKNGAGFWDGWLYGNVDEDGEFTGNEIAYIYADLVSISPTFYKHLFCTKVLCKLFSNYSLAL